MTNLISIIDADAANLTAPSIPVVCLLLVFMLLSISAAVGVLVAWRVHPPDWRRCARRLHTRPWSWRETLPIFAILVGLNIGVATAIGLLGRATIHEETLLIVGILLGSATFHGGGVVLVLLFKRARRWNWRSAFGISRRQTGKHVLRGVVGYLAIIPFTMAAAIVSSLLLLRMGVDVKPQPIVDVLRASDSVALQIGFVFMAIVIAPIAEEVMFRGVALPFLARGIGTMPAILAVSLIFALIHWHVPAIAPIAVLAVGLSLSYLLTGSLLTSIIMHACFNAASIAAFYLLLPVS